MWGFEKKYLLSEFIVSTSSANLTTTKKVTGECLFPINSLTKQNVPYNILCINHFQ